MKLFIDTSSAEEVIVKLGEKEFRSEARRDKSQKLLPLIDEGLRELGKEIGDVTEIEVVTGPGSFTGLRVGVSVANALGWGLGISVNGKEISKDSLVVPRYT